ncbi:hypothetical protein B9Z19DRAFT_1077261 [Tuber borchii]|uniref:Uncharacterized protein n=1 Tax=Tuber borchii TaxID=42251 RepID=A0A2T7A182_TUBBO|nr:hypothetical protein B9Z19DRAFT_1077261 [Tuber borchii]
METPTGAEESLEAEIARLRERVTVLEKLYQKRAASTPAILLGADIDLREGFIEYWYSAVGELDRWLKRVKVYLANWWEKLEAELEDELDGWGVERWEAEVRAEKVREGHRAVGDGDEAIHLRMEVYLPRCFVEYWIWGFGQYGKWLDWIATGSNSHKEKRKGRKEAGSGTVRGIEDPGVKIWTGYGTVPDSKGGGDGEGGEDSDDAQDGEEDGEGYEGDWFDEGHVDGHERVVLALGV